MCKKRIRHPFCGHDYSLCSADAGKKESKLEEVGLNSASFLERQCKQLLHKQKIRIKIEEHKTKMIRSFSSTLFLLLAIAVTSSYAQFRPPSIIGITHIVRYQNTACTNADQESGTCLADAECSRRAGTNIGTCANGYGTCCSFKVSYLL
jgi:hypothetical protein